MQLTNDFHGTTATLGTGKTGRVNPGTVRRVRRELCGSPDCKCAETALGTRGRQAVEIVDGHPDGTVFVHPIT